MSECARGDAPVALTLVLATNNPPLLALCVHATSLHHTTPPPHKDRNVSHGGQPSSHSLSQSLSQSGSQPFSHSVSQSGSQSVSRQSASTVSPAHRTVTCVCQEEDWSESLWLNIPAPRFPRMII